MDTEPRTIGQWVAKVDDGHLCLPSFQRDPVWSPQMTTDLLQTIICHPNRPVGVFLILEADSKKTSF